MIIHGLVHATGSVVARASAAPQARAPLGWNGYERCNPGSVRPVSGLVPKICEFYGVVIRMYHTDHGPPHFHAEHGEYGASITIDGRVLEGRLRAR